jgi:1,4-dihydroxy-2-naphthoate octaprenyltransferase
MAKIFAKLQKNVYFCKDLVQKVMEERKIKTNSARAWLLAARPKTLSGAAVPVMIGVAMAYADSMLFGAGVFSWPAALLCLLFAFIMQIDANLVNDFFDFLRGNDDVETRLGPRRACAQGWVTLDAMKRAIALTTCVACVVGLPLIYYGGFEMLLVGLACVAGCFLYTTHLSYLGLGDVLVLLFFGVVPVCCCYYIQLHTMTLSVVVASVACGLVVDALLLVNNFRDRDNDRQAGKITLVVRLGEKHSLRLYLAVGVVACLLGLVFWANGHVLAFVFPKFYLVLHFYT